MELKFAVLWNLASCSLVEDYQLTISRKCVILRRLQIVYHAITARVFQWNYKRLLDRLSFCLQVSVQLLLQRRIYMKLGIGLLLLKSVEEFQIRLKSGKNIGRVT